MKNIKSLNKLSKFLIISLAIVLGICFFFFSQKSLIHSQPVCSIGNCISCTTQEDCLNAGCEWDIQGFCTEPAGPPPPPPPPGPGEGECIAASNPFTWGTIVADVSGNQATIYNSSAYAWAVHRTIFGCPPPVFNEPPTHQPDEADWVDYRLDEGGWNGLNYPNEWWEGPTCPPGEDSCGYYCCQNTYKLSFTLSGLSTGNHNVDIKVRGQYLAGGDVWEYITAVNFTILPPPNQPPNIPTLIAPPHNTWINYNPTFQAQVSDPDGENVRAYFNISGYGDGWGSWVGSGGTSSWGPVGLPDTNGYWWRAYAQDFRGLTSTWTGYWLVKKDTIKPSAAIDQENGISTDIYIWVNLTESDDRSGITEGDVDVRINGGSWVNTGLPNGGSTINDFTYTGADNNTYEFRYRVKDNAGNWSDYVYDGSVIIDINNPPTATNLNKTDPNWCGSPPFYAFSWIYTDPDGDTESRFDFQILEAGNPVVNRTIDGTLSYPSGTQNNQVAIVALPPNPDIYYGKNYSWRVRVYDEHGVDSGWVTTGLSFTTKPHHYPSPDFTWSPSKPSALEPVQFTDKTEFYNGANSWNWTFENVIPASSVLQNPVATFSSPGSWDVKLEATDSDGFMCPITKSVNVSLPLPKWKEIIPR